MALYRVEPVSVLYGKEVMLRALSVSHSDLATQWRDKELTPSSVDVLMIM